MDRSSKDSLASEIDSFFFPCHKNPLLAISECRSYGLFIGDDVKPDFKCPWCDNLLPTTEEELG
jgi:hypothetical protein